MSKLYITDGFYHLSREEEETLKNDSRVFETDGERYIVKEEYKKEFSKKYNMEVKEVVTWMQEHYSNGNYAYIAEAIYEITEIEPLLEKYWKEKTFSDYRAKLIVDKAIRQVKAMTEEEQLKCFIEYQHHDIIQKLCLPYMIKSSIEGFKEDIEEMRNNIQVLKCKLA